jgi:hypothetical protein
VSIEEIIQVHRLMSAMEVADADVQDSRPELRAIITRSGDAGR